MYIIPAIDLYDKKVVRLLKGDYAKMTVYSDDPAAVACDIASQGARMLHVVDLEGAREGQTSNYDAVRGICAASDMEVEIGGGIRDMETIEKYLSAGVRRVILGTKAVEDDSFLREAVKTYGGDRIQVGVDAKDGKVAVKGWTQVLDVDMIDFVKHLEDIGLEHAIVTDISRDGAMRGTNLDLYRTLAKVSGLKITASGGISNYGNIEALVQMNVWGAIIGKAMYTGDIRLEKAIAMTKLP